MKTSDIRASAEEQNGPRFLAVNQLKAGDVILCYKEKKLDVVGSCIRAATNSAYTHAAIYLGLSEAAESIISGVRITDIRELVKRYNHVAIFRQPDAWSATRVKVLRAFIEKLVSSGVKYNLSGALQYPQQKEIHEKTVIDQLHVYFDGKLDSAKTEKGSYFCSELVADCFVATGFIQPSAAVVYKSDVTSPGALGRDPTFGTFYGYISYVEKYQVPHTDEFIGTATYREIFEGE